MQGIYGDMGRAYDFTSDGPGKGGPYQEFSYESELDEDEEFTSTEDDFEEVFEEVGKSKVIKDRMIVIGVFSLFVVFFWWAFEQAGSSMTIFAKDYTQRVLTGSSATIYIWVNFFLTVVPILIVTWVLALLFKQTYKQHKYSKTWFSH